jgi:hypothetical protein
VLRWPAGPPWLERVLADVSRQAAGRFAELIREQLAAEPAGGDDLAQLRERCATLEAEVDVWRARAESATAELITRKEQAAPEASDA